MVSSVLATDMGAYSIADTLCTDYTQKIFSGVLLSATLGTTISFSLPIALGSIPSKDSKNLMTGMVYGIIAIPVVLIIGSLLSDMALTALLKNLLPVLLICALLGLCIFYGGEKAIRVFQRVGKGINLLAIFLFVLIVLQVFLASDRFTLVDPVSYTHLNLFQKFFILSTQKAPRKSFPESLRSHHQGGKEKVFPDCTIPPSVPNRLFRL